MSSRHRYVLDPSISGMTTNLPGDVQTSPTVGREAQLSRAPPATNSYMGMHSPLSNGQQIPSQPPSGFRSDARPLQQGAYVQQSFGVGGQPSSAPFSSPSSALPRDGSEIIKMFPYANSHEDYIRPTVFAVPNKESILNKWTLPFGAIIQPLAPVPKNLPSVPFINFNPIIPIRCSSCIGYINPFVTFQDNGNKWKCNLCNHINDVPPAYRQPIDPSTGLLVDHANHFELTHGSIEIKAPPSYTKGQTRCLNIAFVLDMTETALASGVFECSVEAIRSKLEDMVLGKRTGPDGTQMPVFFVTDRTLFTLITFDETSVNFYEFGVPPSSSASASAQQGGAASGPSSSTNPSSSTTQPPTQNSSQPSSSSSSSSSSSASRSAQQPHVHTVCDVDDLSFPVPPRRLTASLTQNIHSLLRFLETTLLHHSRSVHQSNLDRIQRDAQAGQEGAAQSQSGGGAGGILSSILGKAIGKDLTAEGLDSNGRGTMQSMHAVGGSAAGSALDAAVTLMMPTGGLIMAFLATRPYIGRGHLPDRFDANMLGNDKEMNLIDTTEMFYKLLASKCVESQISVNIFAFPHSTFLDLASIAPLCEYTGGSLHTFPSFNMFSPVSSCHSLSAAVSSVLLDQRRGIECVVRIRSSRALTISNYYGHFHLESGDLLALPSITQSNAFGIEMELEDSLLSLTQTCVYLQVSCLFTTIKGERRIRLHNLRIPLVSSLLSMYRAFDAQAALTLQTKILSHKVISTPFSSLRSALQKKTARAFANYVAAAAADPRGAALCVGDANPAAPSPIDYSLAVATGRDSPIPTSLKTYMLYCLALEKSPIMRLSASAPTTSAMSASKAAFLASLYPFSFSPYPIANSFSFDSDLLASVPPQLLTLPQPLNPSVPFTLTPSLAVCADGVVSARHFLFESSPRKTLCFLYPRLYRIDTFREQDCEDLPVRTKAPHPKAASSGKKEGTANTDGSESESETESESESEEENDPRQKAGAPTQTFFNKPPLLRLTRASVQDEGIYLFFTPVYALVYLCHNSSAAVRDAVCVPTDAVIAALDGEKKRKEQEAKKSVAEGDSDDFFGENFGEDDATTAASTVSLSSVCPFRPSFISCSSSSSAYTFLSLYKRYAKWQLAPPSHSHLALKLNKLIYNLTRDFCDNAVPVSVFVVEASEDFDGSLLSHLLIDDSWRTQPCFADYVSHIMALSRQA